MLKSRGRDSRQVINRAPAQPTSPRPPAVVPSSTKLTLRTPVPQRAPIAKPEPDYEVVEFPSEQYVNAKLQPPPPPPPRPPTGHPAEAGASCGLCGGGGARVRCSECGRRALCASCDDMYHRHPKRRHHQRQALSLSQLREDRPPLPPKVAAPVPPPRRHKMSGDRTSASPRPPSADPRSATLGPHSTLHAQQNTVFHTNNHMSTTNQGLPIPPHLQGKLGPSPAPAHLGSMPYLPNMHVTPAAQAQVNTLGHLASAWGRPRASIPGFNVPPSMQMAQEAWEGPDAMPAVGWGRPMRRGASVLELSGAGPVAGAGMGSCGCAGWRYGSCASLNHQQWGWQAPCCGHAPPPPPQHVHAPYTPQPYRRADSRTLSRAQSRTCSRAASPAMSTRSRTSRRTRHRTPSPPPLPSSDADSESESEDERRTDHYPEKPQVSEPIVEPVAELNGAEDSPSPAPAPPPPAPNAAWQCEHCTFVNEPGVRVCVICCRTPTSAPKIIEHPSLSNARKTAEVSRSDNAKSIGASEREIAETARSIAHLKINDDVSNSAPAPAPSNGQARVQNGVTMKTKSSTKKERASTGCGPSPPREETTKKPIKNLVTPSREQSTEPTRTRHDMAAGSSPPREVRSRVDTSTRTSPYRDARKETVVRHSVSVGPSPPTDSLSPSTVQKKSTGTSPPRSNRAESRMSSASVRANVSNTGTSPPPQSISTQTYEVPSTYERPTSQSRSRRRFREEARRERSHSRHSLSSDTRESERTSGGGGGANGGKWEWRWGRDSSPGGEWSGSERRPAARLARRASHLDLRRTRQPPRRASFYGSEAASPEPTRAVSLEALAGASSAAERGMELARLMASAEQLGFSAAEVHAALAQSPAAPLAWLRERWGGLCAGVVAAAARLEPRARLTQLEARAALARHRGAMWPAVTECVDRCRRQMSGGGVGGGGGGGLSGAGRVSGRVWGSPAGAEDDAAPPLRAEGSSDEAEYRDDDWMYLPLDANPKYVREPDRHWDPWDLPQRSGGADARGEIGRFPPPALDLSLIDTLLSHDRSAIEALDAATRNSGLDLIQSENDFIEAYNALTRLTPLPGIDPQQERATEMGHKRDVYDVFDNDSRSFIDNAVNVSTNINQITNKSPEMFRDGADNRQQNGVPAHSGTFEGILGNSTVTMEPTFSENIQKESTVAEITGPLTASPDVMFNNFAKNKNIKNIVGIINQFTNSPAVQSDTLVMNTNMTKKEETISQITLDSDGNNNNMTNNSLGSIENLKLDLDITHDDLQDNTRRPIDSLGSIEKHDDIQNNTRRPIDSLRSIENLTRDLDITHDNMQDNTRRPTDSLGSIENFTRDLDITHDDMQDNTRRPTDSLGSIENITRDLDIKHDDMQDSTRRPIEELNGIHVVKPQTPIPINNEVNNLAVDSNKGKEPVRQEDEKQSNLNDIVDTTQRLIQQMKEEINSDINSIDSRNISESEADSSSNESSDISTEHESSYSESEEEVSQNVSNDVSSSADENEDVVASESRPTTVQRSSSDENDQFEEAMDHIEEQMKDFKTTNIELLDSIARSLQEEHTLSVEVNEPRNFNKNTNFRNGIKRGDRNNNLFVKVNSFEEIYEELDPYDENIPPVNEGSNLNQFIQTPGAVTNHIHEAPALHNNDDITTTQEIIINMPKHEIVISTVETAPPLKLLVSENIAPKYNAVLEIVEESLNIMYDSHTQDIDMVNDIKSINNSNLSIPLIEEKSRESEIVNNNEHINNNNISIPLHTSGQNTDGNDTADSSIKPVAKIDITEIDSSNMQPNELIRPENNSNYETVGNNSLEDLFNKTVEIQESNNLDAVNEIIITEYRTDSENDAMNLNNSKEDLNVDKLDTESAQHNENEQDNIDVIEHENNNSKLSNESNLNKISNSIKSNIPKLIKFVQGNKQKQDKPPPKVIASKVPIRKASAKQYPAPAQPKSHFGNVQSGHVKQLQTRLFNNKLPKTAVNIPSNVEAKTVEVKPSTSTLNKKNRAPPPPIAEANQSPPVTLAVPKEKKGSFYRESCRTEDEWTDSESEDSQIQVVKTNDEPERAPSPPPPLTLRRVSGQIIDLAKVQLPEGSPERQARMLLAQGATETWEQARLAVELAARGAEPPAALLAALECADLPAALVYLHQDCELCASKLPEHEMVSMLRCTHRCCRECARHYFTVQITERSIVDCVCPYCKVPGLEDLPEDAWLDYFAHLDILLKTLLEAEVHELFQRKLRDRTLARDPNFRWCMECSSGFFVHPKQKRVRCPECRSQSCAKCRKPWKNHEGLSCEQYVAWLEDNDPERSVAAVQQHLRDNGLECPRCHFKYSLSRGGCMHFTCTQCKYEFCFGCGKPFMMGARCGLSEYCAKLGLHAHHPRNCLFYLRDKEPHQLQTLLQMNDVQYETESPDGSSNRCPIQLQRETPTGLLDGVCGSEVPPQHAGLCKNHYLEYLSRVVRARGVDPLPLLDVEDLETLVRRAALRPPPRPYGSLEGLYRRALVEIVKEKIPLD